MFRLLKVENGRENVPPPVFYPALIATEIGQALKLSSGNLVACGATDKPEFIAMGAKAATSEATNVAVCRVAPSQVYEVPVTAAPTSLKIGDKVTLNTDGLQVTATTTSGVVTIENLNGATAAGDTIIVRIV